MSTLPTPSPEPVPAEPAPSRAVLDDKKRTTIIALLANGFSRRMAAQYVGCASSTITRTAARDPDFRDQLAAAEFNADVGALRALRVAARKPRYWRAAAWLLERRNPNDLAPRKPETYTTDEFARCIAWAMEGVGQDLPEENYQRLLKNLDRLEKMTKEEVQAERAAPFKLPDLEKEWAEAEGRREADELSASQQHDDDFIEDQDNFHHDNDDFDDEPRQISAVSPRPVAGATEWSGPGVRAEPHHADRPLVQHPSSAESQSPIPPLVVTPETPYTSELPI